MNGFDSDPVAFLIRFRVETGRSVSHRDLTNASIAFVAAVASDFGAYSLSFTASFDMLDGENNVRPPTPTAAPTAAFLITDNGSSPVSHPAIPPSQAPTAFVRLNTCRA